MQPAVRNLASIGLAISIGVVVFKTEPWVLDVTNQTANLVLPFLSLRWQQNIINLIVLVLASLPIAALGQSKAAWFGALAGLVAEISIAFSWLAIPPPRPEFNYTGINQFFSLIYVLLFASAGHVWSKYIHPKPASG